MAEQMLGQITVSDSSNHQATGSGARDRNTIDIQLGPQPWIQKGGNYTLTAGGNV